MTFTWSSGVGLGCLSKAKAVPPQDGRSKPAETKSRRRTGKENRDIASHFAFQRRLAQVSKSGFTGSPYK
jgi:hypothetical protein